MKNAVKLVHKILSMKKILLFGAAFDPPHLGHELMVKETLRLGWWDSVWLLPAKRHPFGKILAPDKHRLAMLQQLLISVADPRVRIETYELDRPETSYTYRTLTNLSKIYLDHQLNFLIGTDNLAQFHLWEDYRQLLEQFPFFVYPRVGYPLEPLYPGMTILTKVEQMKISSTQIRDLISQNQPFFHLLNAQITEYIQANRLYLGDSNLQVDRE